MKNYVQDGKAITVTAPADVNSGEVVEVGDALIGFAVDGALSGDDVTILTEGVFSALVGAGVAAGDELEWDGTAFVALSSGVKVAVAVTAEASNVADVRLV